MKTDMKRIAFPLLKHTLLILLSITMLTPFIWMILTAFKSVTESTSVDPFVIFPTVWRMDAFIAVMKNIPFPTLYMNTILMSGFLKRTQSL